MYVWTKDKSGFYNSDRVKSFWVDDNCNLCADEDVIGEYDNFDDAVKELEGLYQQLEIGSNSYCVE